MHDYCDWRLEFGESVVQADGRYLTDVWTEEAVGFIARHAEEPFFLHVTYNAPHTPLQAPEEEVRPFAETGKFNRGVSTLYGMLHRMDAGISRILETLQDHGLEENRMVLFTRDNGPQFGGSGKNRLERFHCQLHGAKGSVYEGGIRVAMLLHWPAGLQDRNACHEMVHCSDWFPTLLAMAGIERSSDAPLDGIDVLPALQGEARRTCRRQYGQWNRYTPVSECNAALRDGDWKLVRPAIPETMRSSRRTWPLAIPGWCTG